MSEITHAPTITARQPQDNVRVLFDPAEDGLDSRPTRGGGPRSRGDVCVVGHDGRHGRRS